MKKSKEPEFFFSRSGINDWQSSVPGTDIDIFKIGKYRSGHPYTNLPHRISFYVERFGLPDFVHVISNKKSKALKAVYAEKGKDMIQLWSFVDIRQEPGWKEFEKAAHNAGFRIMDFHKGKVTKRNGYWLKNPDMKINKRWLDFGTKVEMEHTKSKAQAKKIALDHLHESPNYYKDWKRKEALLFKAHVNPREVQMPKGFSGEWEENDLLDAIDSYNRVANMMFQKGIHDVKYLGSKVIDPNKLVKDSVQRVIGNKKGYLKNKKPSQYLSHLPQRPDSDDRERFERIIELWNDDSLPSVIVIDGILYDGYHRSVFAHAMGQKIVAAYFKGIKK